MCTIGKHFIDNFFWNIQNKYRKNETNFIRMNTDQNEWVSSVKPMYARSRGLYLFLSLVLTYASGVICLCPFVAKTILNCPDGLTAGCISVNGIIQFPIKKPQNAIQPFTLVSIISLSILDSFVLSVNLVVRMMTRSKWLELHMHVDIWRWNLEK